MIYRLLLPILLLWPSLATAQINVRGDLIDAPDRVDSGRTFLVKIKGDLPYSVRPEPPVLTELLDRQGNVVLFLTAGDESMTIQVRHQITHPTAEEIANTPIVTDPTDAESVKRFKDYLAEHSTDEIFQDQHTVTVGRPDPQPGPEPTPEPDLTGTAKVVYQAAMRVQSSNRKAEAAQFARVYRTVASRAAGLSTMTPQQMLAETSSQIKTIPQETRDRWESWKTAWAAEMQANAGSTRESHIDAWNATAEGLEVVR